VACQDLHVEEEGQLRKPQEQIVHLAGRKTVLLDVLSTWQAEHMDERREIEQCE
jgi:hypothetical protein